MTQDAQPHDFLPQEVKDAINLLKDRCSSYVLGVCYDDEFFWETSSPTEGYGLLKRMEFDIEGKWERDLDREY